LSVNHFFNFLIIILLFVCLIIIFYFLDVISQCLTLFFIFELFIGLPHDFIIVSFGSLILRFIYLEFLSYAFVEQFVH